MKKDEVYIYIYMTRLCFIRLDGAVSKKKSWTQTKNNFIPHTVELYTII